MIFVGLSGMFMGPGGEGRAFQGENRSFSSLLGDGEAGLLKLEWLQWSWGWLSLSSTAHPLFQWGSWPLSSASFPSICGVLWSCPLPQAVWAVCLGTPQCEMILICSWQSRGACLQPGRLFCQGLRFQTFDFGGLNRKHFTVCGCWVWHQLLCSHKCWHTSFRLSVIPQAVLYILPGGTRSTLLGELKAKKEWMKISEIPSPALAFLLGWQEKQHTCLQRLGYFHFQISHVNYCIF